jgi:hypothetical protein
MRSGRWGIGGDVEGSKALQRYTCCYAASPDVFAWQQEHAFPGTVFAWQQEHAFPGTVFAEGDEIGVPQGHGVALHAHARMYKLHEEIILDLLCPGTVLRWLRDRGYRW